MRKETIGKRWKAALHCYVAALLLVTSASVSAENWKHINEGRPIPMFLDISRVASNGNRVKAWVRVPMAGGAAEMRWLFEFNCGSGMYRQIEYIMRTGPDIQSGRNDDDPFVGIGKDSGFVPAYLFACKSAGQVAAQPAEPTPAMGLPEPSSEPTAWKRFKTDEDGTQWSIDLQSLRFSEGRVLAWIQTNELPNVPAILVLQEYDCEKHSVRSHAFHSTRFQNPSWTYPSDVIIAAFAIPCDVLKARRKKSLEKTPESGLPDREM
jgi:hypothetical protein